MGNIKVDAVSVDGDDASFTKGKILFFDGTINLNGRLTADIESTGGTLAFSSNNAALDGTLSGTVNLKFNDNYAFSNINASDATLGTITIADGKTLDIGTGTLTSGTVTGGILKATLTDAANESAIITAEATKVILSLDMSAASDEAVTLHHITEGSGFAFGDYDLNSYVVSGVFFDLDAVGTIGALEGWTGGDLYILRLVTVPAEEENQSIADKLKDDGVEIIANEELALNTFNSDIKEVLSSEHKDAVEKVSALLEDALTAGDQGRIKQIVREVAPDTCSSAYEMARSNAGAVMSVISTRMGGDSPIPAARERSGGDYTLLSKHKSHATKPSCIKPAASLPIQPDLPRALNTISTILSKSAAVMPSP
ncbi:MAG: hypothetical protein IJ752_02275 [Alphaproteobacteria bacterium]|nr:hypothetical protein [Alphaproteobacteria bacterium]